MNIFGKKKINVLVLGSDGMLGHDVYNSLHLSSQLRGSDINIVLGVDRKQIDNLRLVDNYHNIFSFFESRIHFDYCINCIAMTDTHAAEHTAEGRKLSYKLNALFPSYLASVCKIFKTRLIHISTDYVFSEETCKVQQAAYNFEFMPLDTPFPVNYYGTHKLLGEKCIQNGMSPKNYLIIRTSWLYGMHNSKSFIHKFIKNALKLTIEDKSIEVTENECSIPTPTSLVVTYILNALYDKRIHGIKHAVCEANEPISRLAYAKCIAEYYNKLLDESNSCKHDANNLPKINVDKIVGVVRNDKLQPNLSQLCYSNRTFDANFIIQQNWKDALYRFMLNNFDKLKSEFAEFKIST